MRKYKRQRALLAAIELVPGISGYKLGVVTRIGVGTLYPDLQRLESRGLIERIKVVTKTNEETFGWFLVKH